MARYRTTRRISLQMDDQTFAEGFYDNRDQAILRLLASIPDGLDLVYDWPWDDDDEPGLESYTWIEDSPRMASPELHFAKAAANLSVPQLVRLGMELCGFYDTDSGSDPRSYRVYEESATTVSMLRDHILKKGEFPGRENALIALEHIIERSSGPMDTYLCELVCLPRHLGGWGIIHPQVGVNYDFDDQGLGRAPEPSGPYIEYDLIWLRHGTALQFVGDSSPTDEERRALAARESIDCSVTCLTTADIQDLGTFNRAIQELARNMGVSLPDPDEEFLSAQQALVRELGFPDYNNMRSTVEDWYSHRTLED